LLRGTAEGHCARIRPCRTPPGGGSRTGTRARRDSPPDPHPLFGRTPVRRGGAHGTASRDRADGLRDAWRNGPPC